MRRWALVLRLVGIGWYIGISIFLGVVGGLWLDSRFRSGPLFTLLGLFFGLVLAFYGTYRAVAALQNGTNGEGKSS